MTKLIVEYSCQHKGCTARKSFGVTIADRPQDNDVIKAYGRLEDMAISDEWAVGAFNTVYCPTHNPR